MDVDIMSDPQKYGYEVCPHCIGHGISLNGPAEDCTCCFCGGLGLEKKDKKDKVKVA